MKKLTIKDVARAAGVSTTVVSKVINAPRRPDGTLDCPDTSRETAERVLKVVNELNYRPSRFAAGLRRGKRYAIIQIIYFKILEDAAGNVKNDEEAVL